MIPQSSPRVSVILPTFNRASILPEAVESVLAQTYQNFEILIIDDGSTDNTASVVAERFGGDPRVFYLRRGNGGPAAARNEGLRHARGEYVAFQDSNDLWLAPKLSLQIQHLDAHPDLAMTFCDVFDRGGPPNGRTRFQGKRYRCDTTLSGIVQAEFPMCTPAVVIRRGILERVGFFDESMTCCEDWDLWLRILGCYRAGHLDMPLAVIRAQNDSLSRTHLLEKWTSMLRLWVMHASLLRRSGCSERLIRRKRARAHRNLAHIHLSLGRREQARTDFLEWWRCQPYQAPALFGWLWATLSPGWHDER